MARLGFREVVGIEVREANFDKCRFVKERLAFTNLTFVNDDVWNLERYGIFDVVFCCGLLYHLDRPKQFLHLLASQTRRALLIKTATAHDSWKVPSCLKSPPMKVCAEDGFLKLL